MKQVDLTFLILQLNSLLDTGKYDDITINEIYNHIDDGTILHFLENRCYDDIDLSLYTDKVDDFQKPYVEHLQSLYDAYGGSHQRKWGVENNGLCLLLAWTNEILQQGSGWKPNQNISKR